ncbi:hypothetical protein [Sinomicrobium sp. M5D2P17]
MLGYLKFLLKSTNQHGVHSPFVYAYVTRGLYTKQKFGGTKAQRLLFRTIAYFHAESVGVLQPDEELTGALQKYFPGISVSDTKGKITYYNKELRPDAMKYFQKEEKTGFDEVLIIKGIHKNTTAGMAWEEMKKNKQVTVTVDLFYVGVVFFRRGQAREDFIIRP